jgi:hypothetical protein
MPGWLSCGFLLPRNLLTCHSLLTRHLVFVLPLVAPPSHLSWLVVASSLITPPLPLNVPIAASQCAVTSTCTSASTTCSPLVNNTPPAPGRDFFWTPSARGGVDEDGINAWFLVGWCLVSQPPRSCHQKSSHKPCLCQHSKIILGQEICASQTHITYLC